MDWNQVLKKSKLDELPMFEIIKRDEISEVLQHIKIFWDGKIEGIGRGCEVINRVPHSCQDGVVAQLGFEWLSLRLVDRQGGEKAGYVRDLTALRGEGRSQGHRSGLHN